MYGISFSLLVGEFFAKTWYEKFKSGTGEFNCRAVRTDGAAHMVWCNLIWKWPRNTPTAVSSHWKICRRMCVSINGRDDLDRWPFDLETGTRAMYASRIKGGKPSVRIWARYRPLGSRSYSLCTRRTDGRTIAKHTAPFPTGRGIIRSCSRSSIKCRASDVGTSSQSDS